MIHSITGTSQHITSDSLLIITLTLGSCSWQILAAMSEFLSVGLVRAYLEALMRRPTTEDQAQRIMTDNMLLLGRNGSFRCHYVLGAAYLAVMGATWESFNVESKASELAGGIV